MDESKNGAFRASAGGAGFSLISPNPVRYLIASNRQKRWHSLRIQIAGRAAWRAKKRSSIFPKSKFADQVTQLALYSLRQLNQPQRLVAYSDRTLAANPDSIPTLLMMADAYAADPKDAAKAVSYANKVLTLVGTNPAGQDKTKRSYAGVAHTTLGRAELNQDKLFPAVADLKTAVSLLQDDPQDQQQALYFLGYASAKQNHKADAVAALEKAAAISGPYQGPAKEMLDKVNAAGPAKKK